MQILRQCEDLVKLKIRKDEDNSGMCLRGHAQGPAAGGHPPASGSPGATRRMLAGYRYLSCWWVLLSKASGLALKQQRQV